MLAYRHLHLQEAEWGDEWSGETRQATSSMTLREISPVSCDMEKFLLKDSFVS